MKKIMIAVMFLGMIMVVADSTIAQNAVRYGSKISFKSARGKYLVAEQDGNANFNRTTAGPWEHFVIVNARNPSDRGPVRFNDKVALRSAHNKYVVAEQDGRLNANRDKIGPWETFTIFNWKTPKETGVIYESNGVSFMTAHSKFIGAVDDGRAVADRPASRSLENFIVGIGGSSRRATPPRANHSPPPNNGGSPYSLCSPENQRCNFNYIGTVAFGVNGVFKYKYNVTRGIDCNVATFGGDPAPGVPKKCYSKFVKEWKPNNTPTETDKPSPPNGNFRVCGVEGRSCNFRGTGRVAYGYNTKNGRKYLFKQNVNGSIGCNNAAFGGDPAPGKAKVCYVQLN
ncbi:MAG: hypothetical protein KDB79_13715 [Acidobacteria bacterium]|nr:hypothetical protein [Acidobacteriota bacterium]